MPEVHTTTSTIHTKLTAEIQLECLVTSQPQANIHWFRHGIPVMIGGRIHRQDSINTMHNTSDDDVQYIVYSKHFLIIKNMRESDFGTYLCRAENIIGTNSTSLEVTGRPQKPLFKRSPLVSTYMTHNLIWQTESLSPIYEYKLQFRQVPSGDVTMLNRHRSHIDWNELIVPAEISDGMY